MEESNFWGSNSTLNNARRVLSNSGLSTSSSNPHAQLYPNFVKIVTTTISYHGGSVELNINNAIQIVDECSTSSGKIRAALFIIFEKFRAKDDPECLQMCLELLEICVKNIGLDFARHMDSEFLRSMSKLLKLVTFKKSLTKDMKKKWNQLINMGTTTNPGVATDPRIHRIKRKILYLYQLWHDSFIMHQDRLPHLFNAYRKLRAEGIAFPPINQSQRFLVKNAETSPVFDMTSVPNPVTIPEDKLYKTWNTQLSPESMIQKLRKAVTILQTCHDKARREKCIIFCRSNISNLKKHIEDLSSDDDSLNINIEKISSLLKLSDSIEVYLLEFDSERATNDEVNDDYFSPTSSTNCAEVAIPKIIPPDELPSGAADHTSFNLLDDFQLLEPSEENKIENKASNLLEELASLDSTFMDSNNDKMGSKNGKGYESNQILSNDGDLSHVGENDSRREKLSKNVWIDCIDENTFGESGNLSKQEEPSQASSHCLNGADTEVDPFDDPNDFIFPADKNPLF